MVFRLVTAGSAAASCWPAGDLSAIGLEVEWTGSAPVDFALMSRLALTTAADAADGGLLS